MPVDVLIPVLAYPNVSEAAGWLIAGFGFTLRWQVGDHRAQLGVGPSAAIAVTVGRVPDDGGDHVMVRVDDLDGHRARAQAAGAAVTEAASFPYGERQYTATDPFGRRWAFSQSVADVDPAEWGATAGPPHSAQRAMIGKGPKDVPSPTASPLISAAELRTSIEAGDPPVLLDVRWRLGADDPRGEYAAGHLPAAIYVDLESELAGAPDPQAGRHPLPSPAALGAAMSRWGVGPDTDVVVYDDSAGTSAARAWWLLRWLGHERVRLLDGGLAAWRAAGGPLTTEVPTPTPIAEMTSPIGGAMPTVVADDIAAGRVGTLLDARAAERFRGDEEPVDRVAGHIPGAVSAPTSGNLAPDGTFLSAAELRHRFEPLGATPDRGVAVCCGSGVTAAHEVLALELAGIPAALYPASWSGWIADPGHPVATGA